jgi:polar amino acid transport system substrate-binding protein
MNATVTRRAALVGIAAGVITATRTNAAPMADAQVIAPTGVLRVAIAISPAPGPFWAGRDPVSHEPKGVTVDIGRAMADALGVPVKLVVYDNSGAITEAGASGAWDVAFVPEDAARRLRLDFGPVYNVSESTFLVRPGLQMETVTDVDKPGIRVAGISNTTTIRAMTAFLKNTTPIGVATVEAGMEHLKSGELDAFGMGRAELDVLAATLPGSHVLAGHFFEVSVAVAVPKGHAAALRFASALIENGKRSSQLRRIFDANGLHEMAIAPIGDAAP